MADTSTYKAWPNAVDVPVEDQHIHITETLPGFASKTLDDMAAIYTADAVQIEGALHRGLPGGTYDRLLILMLERKASYLRSSLTWVGE